MHQSLPLMSGIGLGAGLMYYLDPQLRKRRRTQVREQVPHRLNKSDVAVGTVARDLRHRAEGAWARWGSLLSSRPASEPVVAERVRSPLGRFVSHPRALEVTARAGRVTLS